MPKGSHNSHSLLKENQMEIQRYRTANLPDLMDKISKNSIGMDDYLNSFFNFDTTPNYPPYNLIQLNNVESRLEIALALSLIHI